MTTVSAVDGLKPAAPPAVDAITAEVVGQSLAGIVQEMQNSLFCTGYSTIIRESRDASCAILDAAGRVLAQHTVLPLHLGAFPACAEHLLQQYPPAELEPCEPGSCPSPVDRRPAFFDGLVPTPVYARDRLRAGHTFPGPAIVEQYDATTVLCPGQLARVDRFGNLLVECC